jgi:hypothetical protein
LAESFDLVHSILTRPFGSWSKKELEILLLTELLSKKIISIHDDHHAVAQKLGMTATSYGRLKSEYLAQLPITNPEEFEAISKLLLIKALSAVAILIDGEKLVLTGADRAQRDVLIRNAHRFKLPMEVRGTSIRTTLGALLYLAKEVEDSTVAGIDWMRLAKGVDLKNLEKNLPRAIRQAKESLPEILSVGANVAQLLALFSS